jgi:hypothetical protein
LNRDIKYSITQIKNFDFQNPSEEILTSLFNIIGFKTIIHRIPKNTSIFRCRKHNERLLYYFEKDISFRTDVEKINNYGRANVPHTSKFYGAISTGDIKHGHLTSIVETSSIIRNNGEGIETFTVGKWVTNKELNALTIIPNRTDQKISELNEYLINIFDTYNDTVGFDDDHLEFYDLIGNEFSKIVGSSMNNEYAISAHFAESVIQNEEVDAIIYPSVQSESRGYNIIMNPITVIDNLEFQSGIHGALFYYDQLALFNNIYQTKTESDLPFNWIEMNDDESWDIQKILEFYSNNGVEVAKIIEDIKNQTH